MRIFTKTKYAAFTLTELMVSVGCGVLILAAVVTAGVSLQKSYAATEAYSTTEGNELRVLDYVAMDCRRATSGTVPGTATPTPYVGTGSFVSGSWVASSSGTTALILSLPVYYSSTSSSAVPNTPTLSSGVITYGSGSVTVSYQQSGTNFTREVIVQNSGGTVLSDTITPIAQNVASFAVTDTDFTNWISCSIMFFPTFTHNAGNGTWWSGLNNPDTAPANSVGSNGDWYAINGTATDPTTVGNVYFKSGGTYSLVENEKATTVACKTFLRNASAR
jgi:Tfp pilus assembly protein PilW